jgi:hypothetical protein
MMPSSVQQHAILRQEHPLPCRVAIMVMLTPITIAKNAISIACTLPPLGGFEDTDDWRMR